MEHLATFSESYKQPVGLNALQESLGCFVLLFKYIFSWYYGDTSVGEVKFSTSFCRVFILFARGTKILQVG